MSFQTSFLMDLYVPKPGLYYIVVGYHNPGDKSQELDVEVASRETRDEASITLASCPYRSVSHFTRFKTSKYITYFLIL